MSDTLLRAGAVLIAFAVDRVFGEPPPRCHPVVWMGKVLGATGAPWSRLSPRGQLVCGTVAWIFGSGLVVGVAALAAAMTHRLPELPPWTILAHMLVVGILLKPLLARRVLRDEMDSVERALAAGLEEGRRRLSYLVSRDTRHRLPKLLRCW